MINFNNKTISSVYSGEKIIEKIYKGTLKVYEGWKNLIAGGVPPLTLLNCKGVDLIDYKLYGNSIQNGTPTPETPIEVESVGDKTKNIFNKNASGVYKGSAIGNTGGTYADINAFTSPFIEIKPDTAYILNNVSYNWWACYDENKNFILMKNWAKNNVTPSNAKYMRFCSSLADIDNIQLEEGTISTDYEPYGYKIPVKVSVENLLTLPDFSKTVNGLTLTIENGKCNIAGEFSVEAAFVVNTNITLNPGTYTISSKSGYNYPYLILYADNVKLNSMSWNDVGTKSFTITETTTITSFRVFINSSRFPSTFEPRLEEGDTLTEPITKNIYLNEPLRKIGNYSDYIDFKNKKVVRNIKEKVMDGGTNKFNSLVSSCNNRAVFRITDALSTNYLIPTAYCTHFAYNTTVYRDTSYDELGFISHTGLYYFRFTSASNINTTTLVNEWLVEQYNNGTPMKVLYILATPIEEIIELPNIPTIKGTTIIEVDTEIQPSNMEVEYKGKQVN